MPKLDKPLPGFSGDSVETRYQKALKQITNLISCNNQFKEEAKAAIFEKERLIAENENLKTSLEEVIKQKDDLDKHLTDLTRKYQDLEQDCVRLEKPTKASNEKKSAIDLKLFKDLDKTNVTSQNGIQLRRKIQEYVKVNKDQEKYIKQLETVKQNKNKIINTLTTQCEELNKKVKELSTDLEQFQKYEEIKTESKIRGDCSLFKMSKEELVEKIEISQRYIRNTHNQCVQLQAKLVELQRDKILRCRSERVLGRGSSPVLSLASSNIKLHSQYDDFLNRTQQETQLTEILKKGRKIQSENKTILKKYQVMKLKFQKISEETSFNKKQLETMKKKCYGYEKIIERMQNQILRLMEEYQHDMVTMTEDFRQRLEEQRNTFGPTEIPKHLKELQKLQSQNKAVKKRNQLFRTEISKNGKAMQMYKAKISELQYKLSMMKEQNNQLSEKAKNTSPEKLYKFQKIDQDHSDYINGYESDEQNQIFAQKRKGSPI